MSSHRRKVFLTIACLGVAFAIGCIFWPKSFEQVVVESMGSDRVLLDRHGRTVQVLRTDFNKRRLPWVSLTEISGDLQQTIIKAEDRRFYWHFGVDPIALGRAMKSLFEARRQGGSTITMQVVDLIEDDVLIRNRNIRKGSMGHKLAQIIKALLLDLRWSKDEILESYVNLIHLRGEFQGVPAFSQAFLRKFPAALNKAESSLIATLISAPNISRAGVKARICRIFSCADREAEIEQALDLTFSSSPQMPPMPNHAIHMARQLFQSESRAVRLKSTLDAVLQQKVASVLQKNIQFLRTQNVNDSAAIVIDNKTGEVLAYVGAVPGAKNYHVDGVQATRQAGSTLKPFIYGLALDKKTLTAASILLDDPTAISWDGGVYRPQNYDRQFYGPVSVREALASSLNVPAIKAVLINGLSSTYDVINALHFRDLQGREVYGVSMALGAVDVRLEDLANAYRSFANNGEWSPVVKTPGHEASKRTRVFSPAASFIISSILSDPNARTIGFGWETPLETSFWSAVKTGTSKDYRDNWCVGFTDRYTVAVWAGNFDASAMKEVSGVSGAAPSWYEIMSYLHRNTESRRPAPPADIVEKKIRHEWANYEKPEYFVSGTEPSESVIASAPDKKIQFIFPAPGSVLVKDPHQDQDRISLYVRFKGLVPPGSRLRLGDKILGAAISPFRIDRPPAGKHRLSIVDSKGEVLQSVQFTIKGGA